MSGPVAIDPALLARIVAALEDRRPDPGPRDLVAALAQAYGAQLFTAAEVIRFSEARPGPLRNALGAQLRKVTARALGRLLARIEGQRFGTLSVHRVGEEAAGLIWRVVCAA